MINKVLSILLEDGVYVIKNSYKKRFYAKNETLGLCGSGKTFEEALNNLSQSTIILFNFLKKNELFLTEKSKLPENKKSLLNKIDLAGLEIEGKKLSSELKERLKPMKM